MTVPKNFTAPVKYSGDLINQGAQPFGSPTVAANPGAPPLSVTGNYPARPEAAPSQPQRFTFYVTAPAAVVLTARANPTPGGVTQDGYIPGDTIRTISTATLANTVTVKDGNGAVTRAVLLTTPNANQYADITWDGTNWNWSEGNV